ncbi:hypothetical protein N2603_06980 [Bradyrhizobium huanghuaihaiense]|uniref:hypothetical protein n=1 Tax=Bradyrhizobium huanghuaihaiense TaxID=990078 RepID=UPI0021AA2403|nr:hypothetical protein [Bradyrhizobium sp. CB3035]UWU78195.1 hypothetical protein N2603_06980 [Bradyrhizobium sp. CB3035]
MRRAMIIAAAVIALGAVAGMHAGGTERGGRWREMAWPFPRDGWPAGRAFRCVAGGCDGAELYIRAKRGFCNCDTGVADDDEVDRVTDIDLISPRFAPVAPGHAVGFAAMQGRIRHYDLDMPDGTRHAAAGLALSRRCDLLVAVAQGAGEANAVQRAALVFLETEEMKQWMAATLDGR